MTVSGGTPQLNCTVVLRARPQGQVTSDCFELVDGMNAPLPPGHARLAVQWAGVDPTIRTWITERGSYMPPVAIGEVVRASGSGIVVETDDPERYPLGARYTAMTGWQQYHVVGPDDVLPITPIADGVRIVDAMNTLGQIGMTAYLGVVDVAKPQSGETFLVSAAASGVGSLAGQIARLQGAHVIGIAGGKRKCAWVVEELGFAACIDYKSDDVSAGLKELAPRGVDVFFDNVGGALLDTVLRRIATRGRIVLCGDLSTYDTDAPAPPLLNVRYLMGRRARMEGFNTLDHWARLGEALECLTNWLDDGSIVRLDEPVEGLAAAPDALVRLFAGDHLGKLVVRVDPTAEF
jgi:NADPH-dependent curcumin reductase CurA